jgi:hypothetical protein
LCWCVCCIAGIKIVVIELVTDKASTDLVHEFSVDLRLETETNVWSLNKASWLNQRKQHPPKDLSRVIKVFIFTHSSSLHKLKPIKRGKPFLTILRSKIDPIVQVNVLHSAHYNDRCDLMA